MVLQELLDYWLAEGWTQPTTVCRLHDPLCSCASKSKESVYDFDAVKESYAQRHGIASPSSVDALRKSDNELTFIEIKGWKKFLVHNRVTEKKIDKKRQDYDYKKKLDDSLNICLQTIREQYLVSEAEFNSLPKRYVVVTDVQLTRNPLASLVVNLEMLATTSTSWETMCWQKMESDVNRLPQDDYSHLNMKHPHLIYCADFDNSL